MIITSMETKEWLNRMNVFIVKCVFYSINSEIESIIKKQNKGKIKKFQINSILTNSRGSCIVLIDSNEKLGGWQVTHNKWGCCEGMLSEANIMTQTNRGVSQQVWLAGDCFFKLCISLTRTRWLCCHEMYFSNNNKKGSKKQNRMILTLHLILFYNSL